MSEVRAALAATLGPLFRVEREVRPLGADRLFVVTQSPLGPALLVKVLPAAISLAIDGEQFERKLFLLADKLRHPNLVAPKGGGRAGSFIFHARPFVGGTTLHAWIARHGALTLSRAVDVLRGLLSGLSHAHSADVAHGALRSENVLLGEHGVMVADTGIASVLGHSVVRRADMVSLATIVREMLTGNGSAGGESVERSRSLPAWLTEWIQTSWKNAAEALAALEPPNAPPLRQSGPQSFA